MKTIALNLAMFTILPIMAAVAIVSTFEGRQTYQVEYVASR